MDDPERNGIELYAESPEDGTFIIEKNDFVTRRASPQAGDQRCQPCPIQFTTAANRNCDFMKHHFILYFDPVNHISIIILNTGNQFM